MLTLLAAVLALAAAAALGFLAPPTRPADRTTLVRWSLVAFLLLLPLLHAALVLAGARERLFGLRFDYVGKRLAFGPASPVTAGGSPAGAEEVEDLNAPLLPPRSVTLVPASASEEDETAAGAPAAVLRLSSPSPAVKVNGIPLNGYPLAEGDEIVVERAGGEPVFLAYRGGSVHREGSEVGLQGLLSRVFGAGTRVYELAGLGERLGVPLPGVYSFLYHPGGAGPWHLLIRSDEVAVERQGETVARFVEEHPVPAELTLDLQVVLGGVLRSRRKDVLRIGDDRVEVRFSEPRTWAVTVDKTEPEVLLALTVPSAFSRHEMIELPEPSSRFRGLAAVYRYDVVSRAATLTYFGDTREVVAGDLYALGTGEDQLLLRLDRRGYPRHLLFDLALLALFLGVFLGRGMAAHAGLAAIVGPAGLLLGHRLLFSHKAATQPPDFAFEPFQEARLALWLVPALLLAAWTTAWQLRRQAIREPESWRHGARQLGWPLAGLAVAAAGCWVVTAVGDPGRRFLVLFPLLLALLPLSLELLLARSPRARRALERMQADGVPWRPWWIAAVGLGIFVVRGLAGRVGMPETLRLPLVEFRLLWTVVQLPLAAVVLGLALDALVRRVVDRPRPVRSWLAGVLAIWVFLALAFLGVGVAAGDTGLFLAHGLAPIFGLLVLVSVPLRWPGPAPWLRLALAAVPALPLVLVLWVNVYPETLIRVVGWGLGAPVKAASGAPVRDSAAQLGSSRAQQLFRLYMLASPHRLPEEGLIASERVAIHYATLQSYADEGGIRGRGYLAGPLPRHLGITYLSDLVPMVFVLPDFGKAGLLGLALLYLALLASLPLTARAVEAGDILGEQGLHVALLAVLAVALASLYMILANLNLVLFTGKNMSLLSLNSLSDVLQGGALLAVAVLGLGLRRGVT